MEFRRNSQGLYTSLERDGALAEIGFRLSLEPVWPSRIHHQVHQIRVQTTQTLQFASVAALAEFGVDITRYESFDYTATQALAAAAHFMEFDGLLVPSARHNSHYLIVFMDRDAATSLEAWNSLWSIGPYGALVVDSLKKLGPLPPHSHYNRPWRLARARRGPPYSRPRPP